MNTQTRHNRKPCRIRVLSDGRPGHENQSIGLAQAVQRRLGGETAATVDVVRFAAGASLCERIRAARAEGGGEEGRGSSSRRGIPRTSRYGWRRGASGRLRWSS